VIPARAGARRAASLLHTSATVRRWLAAMLAAGCTGQLTPPAAQDADPQTSPDASLAAADASGGERIVHSDPFDGDLDDWVAEFELPATSSMTIVDGRLDIVAAEGATIWFAHPLGGDVSIEYEVTVVDEGGPFDRVSDMNQFWMATSPGGGPVSFTRDGTAEDYFDLDLYYVGMGGYDNTRTRFRRYAGGDRPLLGEFTDPAHLLVANHTYAVKIVVQRGTTTFTVDGETFFELDDPAPYRQGHFAFRTLRNHERIDNFRVVDLEPVTVSP
jgi:hypothetical protein